MRLALKFRIPIATKLIVITALMMLAATVPTAHQSSELFKEVSRGREEETNMNQANSRALEVEGLLMSYVDRAKIVGSLLEKTFRSPEEREESLSLSFRHDKDLVSIEVWSNKEGSEIKRTHNIINENHLESYGINKSYLDSLRQARPFPIQSSFAGNLEVRNSSTEGGLPLLTLGIPFVTDEATGQISHVILADVRLDRIQKAFASSSDRLIFLVDKTGAVLAHPNEKLALNSADLSELANVREALKSKVRQGQLKKFESPDDNKIYIPAFARNAFGVTVIAQAAEEIILEPAQMVRREAFYVMGRVLSIAIFFIFIFSISLTAPIEKLLILTKEIAHGNFDVQARKSIRSHDEVGELAEAFDGMTEGLKERDKVKNMFNKFHGSSITEDLLKGDVGLGGSNKQVTVFFSDIRDFTKFSEGHTPEEVVAMLNEYFAIMVRIVNEHGGVVDKFVGDAMMAVWGAPQTTGQDSYNAVMASIKMRQSLEKLNELRATRGKTPIKIGMGLHAGPAISGTIGSDERMEYTVIGDTVNMASRIESSTKAFGTDLLVSDDVARELEGKMILELAGSAEVKGKSEPLKMYKVRGYISDSGEAIRVQTAYSDYAAEAADKVKVTA